MNTNQTPPSYTHNRRFRRRCFSTQVGFLRPNEKVRYTTCVDICEDGIRICADPSYKIGEVLELSFFLPDGTFVMAMGKIVHALQTSPDQFRVGLKFHLISPTQAERIREFVDSEAEMH